MNILFYTILFVIGMLIGSFWADQAIKLPKSLDMKKIRFHDVRHTTATLLLKEGWSIKHIQHWLRHSDAQTTAKFYLHTDEEELARVGEGVADMYNKFTTKKETTK